MGETAADEQDLARALDSVADSMGGTTASSPASARSDSSLSFEETTTQPSSFPAASDSVVPTDSPVTPPAITPLSDPVSSSDAQVAVEGPLADIKKDALKELRPLVDKLSVSPEEKFDTYLLLIRSTDDTDLIGPAHEAAKAIEDEPRRAEALLDIIKEIDYLSQHKK